ncbi:hypothetical protein [Achromobacter phage emuu_LB7]|nr:hypothetical protein [Achromobacter phage emuu_LB7]
MVTWFTFSYNLLAKRGSRRSPFVLDTQLQCSPVEIRGYVTGGVEILGQLRQTALQPRMLGPGLVFEGRQGGGAVPLLLGVPHHPDFVLRHVVEGLLRSHERGSDFLVLLPAFLQEGRQIGVGVAQAHFGVGRH